MDSYNTVILFAWALLIVGAVAQGQSCPSGDIVYSPFKPVSQSDYLDLTGGTDNGCWWWAGCVLTTADESRKQQFSSVALVMGLIPLTLKDIAWPERRIVVVSRKLNVIADVLVRTLGLIPVIEEGSASKTYDASSFFALRFIRSRSKVQAKHWQMALLAGSVLGLLLAYAALAVVEIYSKRSALGCPYPVFIFTWHVIALLPAIITTLFAPGDVKDADVHGATFLSVTDPEAEAEDTSVPSSEAPKVASQTGNDYNQHNQEGVVVNRSIHTQETAPGEGQIKTLQQVEEASAVQGRGMLWPIQLCWAIYYIAGTLVYSSIMAVTVIELVVWVFASMFAAAMSKTLAVSICTFF